jgi:hypothetical protein
MILKLYENDITYSHINHLYDVSSSEYVYGLREGTALESKDLVLLLELDNVLGFYIIV